MPKTKTLTNRELQDIAGNLARDIENDTKLNNAEKARALHHTGAIHLRCTRAEVYGINSACKLGKTLTPNLHAKLKMPVYK